MDEGLLCQSSSAYFTTCQQTGFQYLTVLTWPDVLQHSLKTCALDFPAHSILLACVAATVLQSSIQTRDPLTARVHASFAAAVRGLADAKGISPLCKVNGELGYDGAVSSLAWKLVCGCSAMASDGVCRAGLAVENCTGMLSSCTCMAHCQHHVGTACICLAS